MPIEGSKVKRRSKRIAAVQKEKPSVKKISLCKQIAAFCKRVELARKFYHASNGIVVLAAWTLNVKGASALQFVALFLLFSCFVEFTRLVMSKKFNRLVTRVLKPFMRPRESTGLSGNTWFLIGATLVLWLFPLDIASISIIFLSFCDPFASLVGMTLGKRFPIYRFSNNKTVAGMLGGIGIGIITAYIFFTYFAPMRWNDVSLKAPNGNGLILSVPTLSILSGLVVGIAETLVHIPNVDDNFVLPIASAIFLSSLSYLLDHLLL